jgi:hypothetical protein
MCYASFDLLDVLTSPVLCQPCGSSLRPLCSGQLSIDESLSCKTCKHVGCCRFQWFDRSNPSNTNHGLCVLEEDAELSVGLDPCRIVLLSYMLLVNMGEKRETNLVETYMAGRHVEIYMAGLQEVNLNHSAWIDLNGALKYFFRPYLLISYRRGEKDILWI